MISIGIALVRLGFLEMIFVKVLSLVFGEVILLRNAYLRTVFS